MGISLNIHLVLPLVLVASKSFVEIKKTVLHAWRGMAQPYSSPHLHDHTLGFIHVDHNLMRRFVRKRLELKLVGPAGPALDAQPQLILIDQQA